MSQVRSRTLFILSRSSSAEYVFGSLPPTLMRPPKSFSILTDEWANLFLRSRSSVQRFLSFLHSPCSSTLVFSSKV